MLYVRTVSQTGPQLFCQLIGAGMDRQSLAVVRQAIWLGANQTAGLLRGSGKPFACHLVGVASLVAEVRLNTTAIVAALIHAMYQERVPFGPGPVDWRRGALRKQFGNEVESLVWAYSVADALAPQTDLRFCDEDTATIRVMQLADELEDALDGGPWWHGGAGDSGAERGSALDRVSYMRGLDAVYAQAEHIDAPTLWDHYRAVMRQWQSGEWPAELRGGAYTTVPAVPIGNLI